MMAPTWGALRQLTDDDLIGLYDSSSESTVVGLGFYRDEITRRAFERATEAALEEARAARRLAKWNMVAAIMAAIAAVVAIIVPLVAG